MIEALVIVILAPVALVAAAFTLALGVGIVKGFAQVFKKKK